MLTFWWQKPTYGIDKTEMTGKSLVGHCKGGGGREAFEASNSKSEPAKSSFSSSSAPAIKFGQPAGDAPALISDDQLKVLFLH